HQLGEPREEEVRLDAIDAAERSAQVALDTLELLALAPRLIIREHPHGKIVAVPLVLLDRRCRKPLAHQSPPRNVPPSTPPCRTMHERASRSRARAAAGARRRGPS